MRSRLRSTDPALAGHGPHLRGIPVVVAGRAQTAAKGRGTLIEIASRHDGATREGVDDDWASNAHAPDGVPAEGAPACADATELRLEHARSIVAHNDSPDIPFDWSVNPYRGCEHGCIYCYARPTHGWIGLSPGLDFERIIVAKENAPALLARALARPGWRGEPINIGAVTDPYQPAERRLGLTRALLEVCSAHSQPVTIVTKSALVERDIDVLAALATRRLVWVLMTVTTLDPALARTLEPRASAPWRRIRAIRALAEAGVPTGVSVGPVIPSINDHELEHVLEAAAGAGATSAHYTIIRLPWEVAPLFEQWLSDHLPLRASRVMNLIREMRDGRRNDPAFHSRMKGEGVYADLIGQRFRLAARRNSLDRTRPPLDSHRFAVPAPPSGPSTPTVPSTPPARSVPPEASATVTQLSLF
ncbi:MAG: PA0069 family radical SAM protein [Lautropia sp.]